MAPKVEFAWPAPALRPYVTCYWSLDARGSGGAEHFLPGLPFAWIFTLGPPGEIAIGKAAPTGQPAAFVKGLMGSASVMVNDAGAHNYGVAFNAGCAAAFHDVPLGALAGGLTDIAALGDPDLARLADRVRSAPFADAAAALDAFLSARLEYAESPAPGGGLLRHLPLAESTGVAGLAERCGLSPRHLRRLYRKHIGASPKQAQRIARLKRAAELIAKRDRLTDVAYACGYADQAHFTNEFREMVGMRPSAWRHARSGLMELFDEADQPPDARRLLNASV